MVGVDARVVHRARVGFDRVRSFGGEAARRAASGPGLVEAKDGEAGGDERLRELRVHALVRLFTESGGTAVAVETALARNDHDQRRRRVSGEVPLRRDGRVDALERGLHDLVALGCARARRGACGRRDTGRDAEHGAGRAGGDPRSFNGTQSLR